MSIDLTVKVDSDVTAQHPEVKTYADCRALRQVIFGRISARTGFNVMIDSL